MSDWEPTPVYGPEPRIEAWKSLVGHNLQHHVCRLSNEHLLAQYADMTTASAIRAFLLKEPLWDRERKRWLTLSQADSEMTLQRSVRDVLARILLEVAKAPTEGSISRTAVAVCYKPLRHIEERPSDEGTAPSIVIKAAGPSFEVLPPESSRDDSDVGYSNAASCIAVELGENLGEDDLDRTAQSAVFARQMFVQQPNRRFVRNLLVSNDTCQLFHFDRSGAAYSSAINIHERPETFIHLVLAVSSMREDTLGFDTSIRWVIEDGRKASGTITITNIEGASTTYTLSSVHPVFRRYDICGRGTAGWRATSPGGKQVFIKDCWRPGDSNAEYKVLEHVRGVDGVAQMVEYEATEVSTASLRAYDGRKDTPSPTTFTDRVFTRIVMELMGDSIVRFKTQRQLLAAIRDAIAAHRTLVLEREILHCDISQNNILLGHPNAPIGQRGALIDFDLAKRGKRALTQMAGEPQVGTLLYMSVSLLEAQVQRNGPMPAHDQLDDLESFYYVLYDMVVTWDGPGKRSKNRPAVLKKWEDEDPVNRLNSKTNQYLRRKPDLRTVSPYWHPAVLKLLESFYTAAYTLIQEKRPYRVADEDWQLAELEDARAASPQYYQVILGYFDTALAELGDEEEASPPGDAQKT